MVRAEAMMKKGKDKKKTDRKAYKKSSAYLRKGSKKGG